MHSIGEWLPKTMLVAESIEAESILASSQRPDVDLPDAGC